MPERRDSAPSTNETISHIINRFIAVLALIAGWWSYSRLKSSRAAPFGLAVASGLIVVCGGNSDPAATDSGDRIRIATTIYPIEYFVSRIGGDGVEVISLIPPGVEAHDFEPKVSDLIDIASADLLVYNGGEFEPWVDRALDSLGEDAPPALESIELLRNDLLSTDDQAGEADEGARGLDPHVWLSPLNAMAQVQSIVDALATLRPGAAAGFEAGGTALIAQLTALDSEFWSRLSACALNTFITSHAAYGHLADEYGLEQVAVAGLSPDAEPGPRTLAEIANRMDELGIAHVLVEPIASARVGESLARETGGTTLPLHPLESLTKEEQAGGADYFSIMSENLESLVVALDCS